jgi:thymidylate synthase
MQSYLDLLRYVIDEGEPHEDRTGVGTLSTFGLQWTHDMKSGFPLITTKAVPLRWVAEELFWFLSGSTNEGDLRQRGVDIWKEWATAEQCGRFGREAGDLGPVYGALWRRFPIGPFDEHEAGNGSADQICSVILDILHRPNSRRIICTGWHPHYQDRVALPPCHTLWQVKCHPNNELSLHLYARSIDVFLGLPFNIASYALLLKMLARVTDKVPRKLFISFGDLHLYNNHLEQARLQLTREPHLLPWVAVGLPPGKGALEQLLNFRWEHISLEGYRHHPKLPAEVAV